ncbi:DUF6691 family protein [Pseudomonas sp. Irchel 3E20]|uniref:DUF6691 family protein n=1 Tax=Pseudomonas sp. Irchel 3E20 TaxID=2008983 RepID=UPI000BA327CF|nr:DUF6691 family protein [Pseudomonas sp. Irchel 3E20]
MRGLMALCAGVLFGLGLLLSGMVNPAKVLGFLNLAGPWDPSLGLVMVGAIGAALVPLQWSARQTRSLLGSPMRMPLARTLDRRLIGGSLVFGIGWGIAGICPGPAIALLLSGHWQILLFVLAMMAGMAMYNGLERWASP